MSTVLDWTGAALLLLGALLALSAGIGLVRFPDVLSRMHATAKPQALGLFLVLGGTALRLRTVADATTLLLVAAFQLLTVPVAAAMVGRAAYRAGEVDARSLAEDSLAVRLAAGEDPTTDDEDDTADREAAESAAADREAAESAAADGEAAVDAGTGTR